MNYSFCLASVRTMVLVYTNHHAYCFVVCQCSVLYQLHCVALTDVVIAYGSRAFSVAAPTLWKSLPADITDTSPFTASKHFYFTILPLAAQLTTI